MPDQQQQQQNAAESPLVGQLQFVCGMKILPVGEGQHICPNCGRAIVLHRVGRKLR